MLALGHLIRHPTISVMAPPKQKERFNAKARQSSAGTTHKKRKAVKPKQDALQADDEALSSNALLIDPEEQRKRLDADRKRRELLALSQDPDAAGAPISSKKRKRLDAFIARQLKKEKRQQLIADLAKSSAQVGDRSTMMSAATLGTGRVRTGQERLDKNVAREERSQSRRRPHYAVTGATEVDDLDADLDMSSDGSEHDKVGSLNTTKLADDEQEGDERQARIARARALFSQAAPPTTSATQQSAPQQPGLSSQADMRPIEKVGSALAAGPDGRPVMPVMKRRKKQQRKPAGRKTAWGRVYDHDGEDGVDSEFDSSASSDVDAEEESEGVEGNKQEVAEGAEQAGPYSDMDHDSSAESASHLSDSERSSDETDEDEQAILEEAMRLRGLLGSNDPKAPSAEDFANNSQDDEAIGHADHSDIPFARLTDVGDEQAGSDEECGSEKDVSTEGASQDDEDQTDPDASEEDDENGESDSEDEDKDLAPRRRGLPKTQRSQGFKEWAMAALGVDKPKEGDEAKDDDTYKGPEPVAGLSQKIGDLLDGKVRGPLGQDEPTLANLSPFAQKHYQELASIQKAGNDRKSYVVTVNRLDSVQEARLKLPVLADEDKIVRTILENMVTILCGETGSGKTTQVPQFLFEAGFGTHGTANPGMIGVTQPRRVAALSMAARVGYELSLGPDRVSHQIRYDATVSPSTNIKFMTDGVLLRELAADFLLHRYSAIIIDEAHERSVNTDVLIGVLSRVAKLRAKRWIAGEGKPLRLIIMSATLRVDDFAGNAKLFDERPPILQVEARQYPVVTHFNRRTSHNYIDEAVKKACKIHARLPHGGILIFLTGQAEIATVCQRLEKRFGRRAIEEKKQNRQSSARKWRKGEEVEPNDIDHEVIVAAKDADVEVEDIELSALPKQEEEGQELALDVDDVTGFDDVDALDSEDEDAEEYDADLPQDLRDDSDTPMHILPLYSLLPSDRQMQVFVPPPDNTRLVVVATNVAETSLTIPGISYVVDCGRSKERKYDATNGIQSFEVGFISKASADQRAGRAGRTGPGHCYRLYSSNVYEEHFAQFAQPEILRMPVDNLVLMMKSMNIDNVINFPFPTPPDFQAIRRAEKLLLRLGALESVGRPGSTQASASQYKITTLGRSMSLFPLNTRLSKLLVQGHQFDCLPFVVALVAALSVGDPFVREEALHDPFEGAQGAVLEAEEMALEAPHITGEEQFRKERRRAKRSAYFKALNRFAAMSGALSDPLRLLSAVGAYEHAGGTLDFCQSHYLVPKTMEEIHKLRSQVASLVQANAAPTVDVSGLRSPKLRPPTAKQLGILRQFLTSAYIDQIAIRADLSPEGAARVPMLQQAQPGEGSNDYAVSKQFHQQVKQGAKMQSTRNVAYLAAGVPGEACFIHKDSVLFHQKPPEWVIFFNIVRGRSKGDTLQVQGRNWLKGVTVINSNWIYKLGPSLCSLSKAVEVDHRDVRATLVQAAQALKRKAGRKVTDADAVAAGEKDVYLVPTYGTGAAFDASERSSYAGWELPALLAKQRLVNGKWITEIN